MSIINSSTMGAITQSLASSEQAMKTDLQKLNSGGEMNTADMLKFQAKMNTHNLSTTMVTNTQADEAKTLKGIIDNIR